ncbi:hypothetical protein C8R45DRAFT_1081663, partial [Mycena sanguinolenta]
MTAERTAFGSRAARVTECWEQSTGVKHPPSRATLRKFLNIKNIGGIGEKIAMSDQNRWLGVSIYLVRLEYNIASMSTDAMNGNQPPKRVRTATWCRMPYPHNRRANRSGEIFHGDNRGHCDKKNRHKLSATETAETKREARSRTQDRRMKPVARKGCEARRNGRSQARLGDKKGSNNEMKFMAARRTSNSTLPIADKLQYSQIAIVMVMGSYFSTQRSTLAFDTMNMATFSYGIVTRYNNLRYRRSVIRRSNCDPQRQVRGRLAPLDGHTAVKMYLHHCPCNHHLVRHFPSPLRASKGTVAILVGSICGVLCLPVSCGAGEDDDVEMRRMSRPRCMLSHRWVPRVASSAMCVRAICGTAALPGKSGLRVILNSTPGRCRLGVHMCVPIVAWHLGLLDSGEEAPGTCEESDLDTKGWTYRRFTKYILNVLVALAGRQCVTREKKSADHTRTPSSTTSPKQDHLRVSDFLQCVGITSRVAVSALVYFPQSQRRPGRNSRGKVWEAHEHRHHAYDRRSLYGLD